MSQRLTARGLVIAAESIHATVRCTGCARAERWLGVRAESAACESARQHAEATGHAVTVESLRHVEYDRSDRSPDRRLPRGRSERAPIRVLDTFTPRATA